VERISKSSKCLTVVRFQVQKVSGVRKYGMGRGAWSMGIKAKIKSVRFEV
jgi:hypothetical protein